MSEIAISEKKENIERSEESLVQATIRIRADQRNRLEVERRARGTNLADVLRDNLDLAFAVKEELSKIVEGEYDQNDPKNAPRLVHSLLFRVEERILGALDSLSQRIEHGFASHQNGKSKRNNADGSTPSATSASANGNDISVTIENFLSLVTNSEEHSPAIWIGAFLEVVPRLELVGMEQLGELQYKGETWLEEHGYYSANNA